MSGSFMFDVTCFILDCVAADFQNSEKITGFDDTKQVVIAKKSVKSVKTEHK